MPARSPGLLQIQPIRHNRERRREVDFRARGADDCIDLPVNSIFGLDTRLGDARNGRLDEADVILCQRLQVARTRRQATTMWRKLGHQEVEKFRLLHQARLHQFPELLARRGVGLGVFDDVAEALPVGVFQLLAVGEVFLGVFKVLQLVGAEVHGFELPVPSADGAGDPGPAAGVVVEVRCRLLDLGHDLDARGAVADDRDPFACGIEVRIPVGRVSEVAFERVQAWVVGKAPVVEQANRGDDEVKVFVALLSRGHVLLCEFPLCRFGVPRRGHDFGVELCELVDVVFAGHVLPVSVDLGALGEFFAPLCVWCEG